MSDEATALPDASAVDRATALIRAFIVDSAGWDGGELMTVQARELAAQLADDGLLLQGPHCGHAGTGLTPCDTPTVTPLPDVT